MKVLMVFAHPEPKSFGAALLRRGVQTLKDCGHEVQVSDLYAMDFEPVAHAGDFTQRRFPNRLQYDREQKFAAQHSAFVPQIQQEIDKLQWCDLLILQFPMWWFSMPAILKGWVDRVFANGVVYGSGKRFETGGLKGKRAMVTITTGCEPTMMEPDGLLGDLNVVLWHLHHGTFGYAGLQALPPYACWFVNYTSDEQRNAYLDGYEAHLRNIDSVEPLPAHWMRDFGPDWRLKPGIDPRTAGHRRVQPASASPQGN